jgi:hypothetical protein
MKLHIFLPLFLCLALMTFAQENKIPEEKNNLSVQYAEAAAYFEIVAEGLSKSGRDATKYAAEAQIAMAYALTLASEGRTQDVAVKVTIARIESSKKMMLREMEYRNENITIIENKYADQSFELMKNLPKDVREAIVKHVIMPAQGGKNAPTDESKKK